MPQHIKYFKQHALKNHLLVLVQLSGVALSCFPVDLKNNGDASWLILCVAGAVLGVLTLMHNKIGNFSIYPEIKPQAKLITTGPYAYIRHPMYTSLIIMMLGIALYNYHWLNMLGAMLVTVSVIGKASVEEKLLLKRFSEYAQYQAKSQRFIPFLY